MQRLLHEGMDAGLCGFSIWDRCGLLFALGLKGLFLPFRCGLRFAGGCCGLFA